MKYLFCFYTLLLDLGGVLYLKIGLDFDDVIAHSHVLKPAIAKSLFGVDISMDEFRRNIVVGKRILTDEQYTIVVKEVYAGKHRLPPVQGSVGGLHQILELGHEVKVVTNRSVSGGTLQPALDWLSEHGFDFPVVGVPYGTSKAEACAGLDLFVDDDPGNLSKLVGTVPNLLFFSWSHTSHEVPPEGSIYVYSWDDVLQQIAMISFRGVQ